jgi:hypothetical protein
MQRSFAGVMTRVLRRSWTSVNARLGILATEDESAYYAWVDEYLDRLAAEAAATTHPGVAPRRATLEDVASG